MGIEDSGVMDRSRVARDKVMTGKDKIGKYRDLSQPHAPDKIIVSLHLDYLTGFWALLPNWAETI